MNKIVKKAYICPTVEVENVETTTIICTSPASVSSGGKQEVVNTESKGRYSDYEPEEPTYGDLW